MFERIFGTVPHVLANISPSDPGHGDIRIAVLIVLFAGLSEALGQSIVLFVNRIRPQHLGLALLITALSHMVSFLLWTASVWLVGSYFFGRNPSIIAVATAVGLAYIPQLLAFFTLIPFLGNAVACVLSLWSLLALVAAVQVALGLPLGQAIVASGLGWVLIQLWKRTLGQPIYALGRWMKGQAAGAPLRFTLKDVSQLRHRPQQLPNVTRWSQQQPQQSHD